ncbi:MAG: helix-turn-helix transcriptional regulator [Chlorobiales bacterium]|nr:helix-turn-helix transcriptional regulator [Chlorobiales bacterium]
MNNKKFGEWLALEREKREWSQSDLSRFSGLHRAVISKLESGTQPMPDTLNALAIAFDYPSEFVFRAAGILPQQTPETETIEQIAHLTKQLPPQEQSDILEFIKLRHRIAQEREKNETKRTRNKPALP